MTRSGRARATRPLCALVASSVFAACGARSALERDVDAGPTLDAPVEDRPLDAPTPDACVSGAFPLRAETPRALLLIDRSGSMALDLYGTGGIPRRWDVFRSVLFSTLRTFESSLEVGAMMFPVVGGADCGAPTRLDVPFARSNATPIARTLAMSEPDGRTPTFAALVQAERVLLGSAGEGPRAVVLATDGGPNCNGALDGNRCLCAAGFIGFAQDECRMDPSLCLDDLRTVAQIEAMRARAVPTYVIGIDGGDRSELVETLDCMARAGGRPNPRSSTRAYYSVRQREDLEAALRSVGQAIVSCTRSAPFRPPPGATVTVRVGGARVPRDPSRAQGWDWSAPGSREFFLAGTFCDAAAQGAPVEISIACDPR